MSVYRRAGQAAPEPPFRAADRSGGSSCETAVGGSGRALYQKSRPDTSAEVKSRVCRARDRQTARACNINARLTQSELQQVAPLRRETQRFLSEEGGQLEFSVRGYHRVLRVARTIADLEDTAVLTEEHLAEALQYRVPDRAEAGLA